MKSGTLLRYLSRAAKRTFAKHAALLTPPYEYVQHVTEGALHKYLWLRKSDIHKILIVGAYRADEVSRMLKVYRHANFVLFEASPRYYKELAKRFAGHQNVVCENIAVSDACGELEFFETNLRGSGSLPRVNEAGERDYGMRQAEIYTINAQTLDAYLRSAHYNGKIIDMLWCDVQGAEMKVLQGLADRVTKCRAIFLEVSMSIPTYEGGCTFEAVFDYLRCR